MIARHNGRVGVSRAARALPLLGLAALFACEDVLNDEGFKLWCGDVLCHWQLDAGELRRAPTWHEDDSGVELLGSPAQISQGADESNTRCLELTMVTDVDASAQMKVMVDFNDDGTYDYEQPVPEARWKKVRFLISAPTAYSHVRFALRKEGRGRAVLSVVQVKRSDDCTAPPIELHDLPLGLRCGSDSSCKSGVCCAGICSECCKAEDNERGCWGGQACKPIGLGPPITPSQCDPQSGARGSGSECIDDADCASGICEGLVVENYRSDLTSDGCTNDAHVPGEGCTPLAIRAGVCR